MNDVKSDIKTADMILPGLDEALAFDELLKHMENPTWDVVVFDTAPTGHTLRFLSLPELIEAWSGRLLRFDACFGGHSLDALWTKGKRRHEGRTRTVPPTCPPRPSSVERSRYFVLHARHHPERMGINETMRAYDSLVEYNLPIGGCSSIESRRSLTIRSSPSDANKNSTASLNSTSDWPT